jgi:hypothetical protein
MVSRTRPRFEADALCVWKARARGAGHRRHCFSRATEPSDGRVGAVGHFGVEPADGFCVLPDVEARSNRGGDDDVADLGVLRQVELEAPPGASQATDENLAAVEGDEAPEDLRMRGIDQRNWPHDRGISGASAALKRANRTP